MDTICRDDEERLDRFHDIYVKRIKKSVDQLRKFIRELLGIYEGCKTYINPKLTEDIEVYNR